MHSHSYAWQSKCHQILTTGLGEQNHLWPGTIGLQAKQLIFRSQEGAEGTPKGHSCTGPAQSTARAAGKAEIPKASASLEGAGLSSKKS